MTSSRASLCSARRTEGGLVRFSRPQSLPIFSHSGQVRDGRTEDGDPRSPSASSREIFGNLLGMFFVNLNFPPLCFVCRGRNQSHWKPNRRSARGGSSISPHICARAALQKKVQCKYSAYRSIIITRFWNAKMESHHHLIRQ